MLGGNPTKFSPEDFHSLKVYYVVDQQILRFRRGLPLPTRMLWQSPSVERTFNLMRMLRK